MSVRMSDPELQYKDASPPGGSGSEARLMEVARQGDSEAFGELVRRYEGRLLSVIRRFVTDVETARDLAQDTFLKAYERIEQFDPSRRFGPWLFRIGVNVTLDFLRRRKRRVWFTLFSQTGEDRPMDPSTPDPRVARDLEQEVRAVLDQLPEKHRTILVLRDLENFSSSEIAAILQRKEATVRWRVAEARREFQRVWESRQAGEACPIHEEGSDDETSD